MTVVLAKGHIVRTRRHHLIISVSLREFLRAHISLLKFIKFFETYLFKIGHPDLSFKFTADYPYQRVLSRSTIVYSHNAYYVIGGYGQETMEANGKPINTIAKYASNTWSQGKKFENMLSKLVFKICCYFSLRVHCTVIAPK